MSYLWCQEQEAERLAQATCVLLPKHLSEECQVHVVWPGSSNRGKPGGGTCRNALGHPSYLAMPVG